MSRLSKRLIVFITVLFPLVLMTGCTKEDDSETTPPSDIPTDPNYPTDPTPPTDPETPNEWDQKNWDELNWQ